MGRLVVVLDWDRTSIQILAPYCNTNYNSPNTHIRPLLSLLKVHTPPYSQEISLNAFFNYNNVTTKGLDVQLLASYYFLGLFPFSVVDLSAQTPEHPCQL